MRHATTPARWLGLLLALAVTAGSAYGQEARTVTLTLNTATIPDTTQTTSFIEVRGAVVPSTGGNNIAPATLLGGDIIDWGDASTLEPENIGGDYWQISFDIADTTNLEFKFFSGQAEALGLNGWEADPNPRLPPGENDTTLTVHYFESQSEYRGVSGDRGDYDWRPFESKEDSVAIWFRVAMYGDEARQDEYDAAATAPDQTIGVRGDELGGDGPLDWGTTDVLLTRESMNQSAPAYRIYSGVAYYPEALAGTEQNYKFVIDRPGVTEFEEGNLSGNRTFTVPESDSTLHWVYYGNTAPSSVDPVQSLVLFAVDLSPFEDIGLFDQARGDTLWVFGGFNGWQDCPDQNPDDCLMGKVPGEDVFEAAVPITQIPGTNVVYKYFLDFNDETFMEAFGVEPPSGWEEAHATGTNRFETFSGDSEQDLGVQFFNDVTPGNVIPDGATIDVTFEVDMTAALTDEADPFEPAAGDSVTIRLNDPIWAFTQGIVEDPRGDGDFPLLIEELVLEDDDGDDVYTGTYTVAGPTYDALTFRFAYGQGTSFVEEVGTDTNVPGRNRVVYLDKNPDGTYVAEQTITATFDLEAGPLPFETNPEISTAIEVIDDEVPSSIFLGQNYPNPFNPTTTFEYAIGQRQQVRLVVYDLLGRAVATLVDGLQPAATYQVTFDASQLASGVYLYRLETETATVTKRMLLIK